jgi:2'-5' RNA ligase
MRRLFVAAPLPDDAAAAVVAVVDRVRGEALPKGMRDVRWVRLDGLHLTLRFLGPTPEPQEAATVNAVAVVAAACAPIAVTLRDSGAFPLGGRPRTIWIGVGTGADALADLAQSVNASLETAGWPHEDRPFRPHLTLARSDGLAAGPVVAKRLGGAMAHHQIDFVVERLTVFESVTGGGPARYLPVATAPLANEPTAAIRVPSRNPLI